MDGNRRWTVQIGLPLKLLTRKARVGRRVVPVLEDRRNIYDLFVSSSRNWKGKPARVPDLLLLLDWKITQAWLC